MNRLSRKQYGILQARVASMRSEDPFTQVGCLVVNEEYHTLATGYNGFVKGYTIADVQALYDSLPLQGVEFREFKNLFAIHSEMNALRHVSISDQPHSIFLTHSPCTTCSAIIASYGIQNVYFHEEYDDLGYKTILNHYNIYWERVYENL